MGLLSSFGTDWNGFVTDYLLSSSSQFSEEEAELAIDALEKLWPERLADAIQHDARGIAVMMPLLDDGLMLARAQAVPGFTGVMKRLRAGDDSAKAELCLAAHLVTKGQMPELEVPLENRVLDVRVETSGIPIYCEVIAPKLSDVMQETYSTLQKTATGILANHPGEIVECFIRGELSPSRVDEIIALAKSSQSDGTVVDHSGIGLARRFPVDTTASSSSVTPPDAPSPILVVTNNRIIDNQLHAQTTLRLCLSDQRAARLMEAEAKHFPKTTANVVIMNVTRIPGGIETFASAIQRRFQPNLNRRFGAVILFDQFVQVPGVCVKRWRILNNPHAYIPLPPTFSELFDQRACD